MHADTGTAHGLTSAADAAVSPAQETPFKTSVMLWTVMTELPFDQRLEKMAEAGYRAVELSGEYANWTDDDFRRYNQKRAALGITFDLTTTVMVAPGQARHAVADPSEREGFLADIRSLLPIMERIECPALSVMSGNVVPGLSPQAQHDSCVEGLKRAAELVEGKDVTILLENVDLEENPRYYAWSISESTKITEEVGHPQVKVLYDLYHGQVSGGNLIANLERHLDQIGLVQIGDVPGHHEPGTGEINYLNIYKKLAELKYDRYVAMEFFPSGDPVDILARAREEALQAVRS